MRSHRARPPPSTRLPRPFQDDSTTSTRSRVLSTWQNGTSALQSRTAACRRRMGCSPRPPRPRPTPSRRRHRSWRHKPSAMAGRDSRHTRFGSSARARRGDSIRLSSRGGLGNSVPVVLAHSADSRTGTGRLARTSRGGMSKASRVRALSIAIVAASIVVPGSAALANGQDVPPEVVAGSGAEVGVPLAATARLTTPGGADPDKLPYD